MTASQTIAWPSGVQSKRLSRRCLTSCPHTGGLGSALGLSAASCRLIAERWPLLSIIRKRLTNTFSSTWVIQVQRVETLETQDTRDSSTDLMLSSSRVRNSQVPNLASSYSSTLTQMDIMEISCLSSILPTKQPEHHART